LRRAKGRFRARKQGDQERDVADRHLRGRKEIGYTGLLKFVYGNEEGRKKKKEVLRERVKVGPGSRRN